MPGKRYTNAQRAEAVALATIVGSEAAGDQLGIDQRTVRTWMGQAGRAPELEVPQDGWRGLMDLALARTTAAVASGKLHPKVTAVIAGIAARNVRDRPEPEEPPTEAEEWGDRLMAALKARYSSEDVDTALVALIGRYEDKPEVDDIADVLAWLESLGDLPTWYAEKIAERSRRDREMAEQNRRAALRSTMPNLSDEDLELIARAEAELAA